MIARPSRTDALEALSLRVGLATAAALELACPALPRLGLKWPNDLMVDGRKLAGILCEARWGGGQCQWVVIGLGVNVRNAIPPDLRSGRGRASAPGTRRSTRRHSPRQWRPPLRLAAREAGPLTPRELRAYALRDVLAGARVSEPVAGTAEGITAAGALRVRTDTGPMREVLAGVVA